MLAVSSVAVTRRDLQPVVLDPLVDDLHRLRHVEPVREQQHPHRKRRDRERQFPQLIHAAPVLLARRKDLAPVRKTGAAQELAGPTLCVRSTSALYRREESRGQNRRYSYAATRWGAASLRNAAARPNVSPVVRPASWA
jgi:hypothetical protein